MNNEMPEYYKIFMSKREKNNYFTNEDVLWFEYLSTIISSALLYYGEEKKSLLSKREQEVVILVKKGYTNTQIHKLVQNYLFQSITVK